MILYDATPFSIRDDLARARENMLDRWEAVVMAREKATSAGAIRYDKDRVQSSNTFDLTDVIIHIIDLEEALEKSKKQYNELLETFKDYMTEAGFDSKTTAIWMYRYGKGYSIGRTAKALNTTRSHVQYYLGQRAEEKFLAVAG